MIDPIRLKYPELKYPELKYPELKYPEALYTESDINVQLPFDRKKPVLHAALRFPTEEPNHES